MWSDAPITGLCYRCSILLKFGMYGCTSGQVVECWIRMLVHYSFIIKAQSLCSCLKIINLSCITFSMELSLWVTFSASRDLAFLIFTFSQRLHFIIVIIFILIFYHFSHFIRGLKLNYSANPCRRRLIPPLLERFHEFFDSLTAFSFDSVSTSSSALPSCETGWARQQTGFFCHRLDCLELSTWLELYTGRAIGHGY